MSNLGTDYVGGFNCGCRLIRRTGREQVTSKLKQKGLQAGQGAADELPLFCLVAERIEGTGMANEADGFNGAFADPDRRGER